MGGRDGQTGRLAETGDFGGGELVDGQMGRLACFFALERKRKVSGSGSISLGSFLHGGGGTNGQASRQAGRQAGGR